jgi:hypothetical protein
MQEAERITYEESAAYGPDTATPTTAADAIRARIVRIYASVAPGGRQLRDDEAGDLDSMAFLEFIMALESEFGLEVDVADLDEANFANTSATTEYIQRRLGERHP